MTYHHFLGEGTFDSQLDVILHSTSSLNSESVTEVICKLRNPLIQSHHDLIVSSFSLAHKKTLPKAVNAKAPRVDNTRVKIVWSEEGIEQYVVAVGDDLSRLRDTWCDPSSPASMSILLQSTYAVLSSAAKATNKFISLADPIKPKPRHHPHIVKLQKNLLTKYKSLASLRSLPNPDTTAISNLDDEYLKLNKEQRNDSIERDKKQQAILSSNPSAVFSSIKHLKNSSTSKIGTLHVGEATYEGDEVPDGFFASLRHDLHPLYFPIPEHPQ